MFVLVGDRKEFLGRSRSIRHGRRSQKNKHSRWVRAQARVHRVGMRVKIRRAAAVAAVVNRPSLASGGALCCR